MAGAAGKGGFYSGRHTKVAAKFMAVAEPPSLQQAAGRQEQASCERAASARRETIARKRQREREWERDTIIGLKAQANCRCHSALHPFELCVKLSAVSAKGCNNFGAANAKETPRDLRNIKLFARERQQTHTLGNCETVVELGRQKTVD